MNRLEAHERAFNMILNVLFWVIWTLALYFIVRLWFEERSDEIAMVAFFYAAAWVAATYVFARYILLRKPILSIDAAGLYDRRVFTQPVPWSDITDIRVKRGGLTISLREPFKYRRTAALLGAVLPRAWFAKNRVDILFRGLNRSAGDITAAVRSHAGVTG